MRDVTVVITTIGRPDFLRTALQSVSNQVNRDVIGEVVVSENKGDRRTEQVVREFPDLPIRYLFREPSRPQMDHLFSTVREARTPYVAILNDDDWWSAGHVASGVNELRGNPKAAAYVAASLFVVDESHTNPRWIDRTAALWLFAGTPSWMATWTLGPREMLALCWVFTPFHISSMIARTDHLFPVLDELEGESYHTHTSDRLIFAHLAVRGNVHYSPVPDTFVRWHSNNWIKTQTAEAIEEVGRSTRRLVDRLSNGLGWSPVELWKERLSAMPADVELEVLERLHQTFGADDLDRLGLAGFFRNRPPNLRLQALRGIAANAKRLVVGS
jgi:hypothetical protein